MFASFAQFMFSGRGRNEYDDGDDYYPHSVREEAKFPDLKNSGKMDSFNDKASEIVDLEHSCFNGVQFSLQNILHPSFLTIHTIHLGKRENVNPFTDKPMDDERALYAFSTFLRTSHWLFNGRWATGSMPLRTAIHYERGPFNFGLRQQFGAEDRGDWDAELSFNGGLQNFQVKLQGPLAQPVLGFAYTHPLTKVLSGGIELFVTPMGHRLKYMGKAEHKDSVTAVSCMTGHGPIQYAVSYTKTIQKNLDLCSELNLSQSEKKWGSQLKFGYHYRKDNVSLKGLIDSEWKVMSVLEQPIFGSWMMQGSVKVDYLKNNYDFGVGITASM